MVAATKKDSTGTTHVVYNLPVLNSAVLRALARKAGCHLFARQDDVVYALVKNLFSHLDYLKQVHQATSVMSLDGAIDGLMLPLHPGAARFFTEQGLEVPPSLR